MGDGPRAAVCGLGRIGRHHAKWYRHLGCELVGFTARSAERLAAGAADLSDGGVVPGYLEWERLLDEQRPDLVSICTPAEAHAGPAAAAIERGIAVLCEKPLVWAERPEASLREADRLVRLAAERGVLLAVNLQYAYAAEPYLDLVGVEDRPERCEVVLESRGRGTEREPAEIWMELGPHAVSLVFALLPSGRMMLDTLRVEPVPRRVEVAFDLATAAGDVAVSLSCGQRPEGELVRRFGVNGRLVELAGRANAAGVYATYLRRGDEEREYPDLMSRSLARFIDAAGGGEPVATDGREAVSNLGVQWVIAEALAGGQEGRSDG